ncbi:hypothetical protein [Antricoccus suffuscus]|uniref:hypothetical protein n=1 Tax=Antricoccus suffuscus TaxID=1629062 RepID=UPI0011B1F1F6|nr:hypothetical protein [Antricoccus suffuscus]
MTMSLIAATAGTLLGVPAAAAAPAYAAGTDVCTVTDSRIVEGSGLLVRPDGYDIINDSGDQVEVFHLDQECQTTAVSVVAIDPRDTEDLARGPNGLLYVADIGDNNAVRDSVALELVDPADPSLAQIRRFRYPDGAHDAESLFVQSDGRIVIVTKSLTGLSGVYRSSEPVDIAPGATDMPQPLDKVGDLRIDKTDTPGGPVGWLGSRLVTGAAASADDTLIALRTYTDAYIWDLDSPDIAGTLVGKKATVIPLPPSPQGEAIAFAPQTNDIYLFGEGQNATLSVLPVTTTPGDAVASRQVAVGDDARVPARNDVLPYVVIGAILLACAGVLLVAIRLRKPRHGD